MKNTVKLKDYLHVVEEYPAAAAITPGMLVEVTAANEVQAHSTDNGEALTMLAGEDEFQGKTINDAYAANERVQCWLPQRGDMAYAILTDNQVVAVGDWLTSAGNGTVRKYVPATDAANLVGQAVEAVTTSGATGRIIVRIF